jgi:hypothetical protein
MKIRLVSTAFGDPTEHDGRFIKSVKFDVDELGRALLVTTPNEDDALDFPDSIAAFEFWKTQSKTVPLRPDGKPNRPLTAWTIQLWKSSL